MTYADDLARVEASIPLVDSKVGIFVARSGHQVTVNVGATTVMLPFTGMSLPPAGHPVRLELRGDRLVCTGSARPLPGIGVVTATGTPRATVSAWGQSYTLPFRSGYTPAVNDTVDIQWTGDGGVIQGRLSTTPTIVTPDPPPSSGPQTFHPAPFTAIDSGSFQSGRWTKSDVWSSASLIGAWFYGSKIADSIPDGASIQSAAIYLSPTQVSGAGTNLQLHTSPTKPGGTVAFTGAVAVLNDRAGWQPIPLAFVDFLKANQGGIGANHGGYSIYRSIGADGLSGALDISWVI